MAYFCAINRGLYRESNFFRYFGFACALYFVGVLGLILSNVYYRDDLMRSMFGATLFMNESRLVAEYGSRFLGMMDYETKLIADASPLFQLIAIAILSFGSVSLVKIINGKLSTHGLIAALPLGLSPYFLANLSYQFDAPFHAFAVVASVVPFLYLRRVPVFVLMSILGILVTFTTYQAAHGIYILICIFVVTCSLGHVGNQGSFALPTRKVTSFIMWSAASYLVACVVYFLVVYKEGGYKSGSPLFSFNVATLQRNIVLYIEIMRADFRGTMFEVLLCCVCAFFVASFVSKSKARWIFSLPLALGFVLCTFFAAYGVYFFLDAPFLRARAFCGFGVFLAVMAVFISKDGIFDKILTGLLGYNLIVTSSVYANSLSAQHEYANFRRNMMIVDLLKVLPGEESSAKIKVHVRSFPINPAPATANSIAYFPLLKRIGFEYFGENMYFTQWQFRSVRFDYIPYNDYWKAKPLGGGKSKGYVPKSGERICRSPYISTYESQLNVVQKFEGNCYEVYFKPGQQIRALHDMTVVR